MPPLPLFLLDKFAKHDFTSSSAAKTGAVISCGTFSKILAPGMTSLSLFFLIFNFDPHLFVCLAGLRLGYVHANAYVIDKLKNLPVISSGGGV